MSDDSCQRCGERIKGKPAVLAIERDRIPLEGSPLSLCQRCVHSYERWLESRRKHVPRARTLQNAPAGTGPSFWRRVRRVLLGFGVVGAAFLGSDGVTAVVFLPNTDAEARP